MCSEPLEPLETASSLRRLIDALNRLDERDRRDRPARGPDGVALERATVSVPEAARMIGCSRNAAYAAARAGTIPVIRIGARILVLRRPLEAMLAGQRATTDL
jgi:hypothetical protein